MLILKHNLSSYCFLYSKLYLLGLIQNVFICAIVTQQFLLPYLPHPQHSHQCTVYLAIIPLQHGKWI